MSVAELPGNTDTPRLQIHGRRTTRIAVVGCGPRGLYCLESLLRKLNSSANDSPIEISIYEPTPWLGAGNVYSPTQPSYLRMNFATRFIDAWTEERIPRQVGDDANFAGKRPSLAQWLKQHHPKHADPNGYAPRAMVGEYLMDCYEQVVSDCPDNVSINVIPGRVTDVVRSGRQWRLCCDSDSHDFDEVVVATGHGGLNNGKCLASDGRPFEIPAIKDVFPVNRNLGTNAIEPQSVVAIRGFGLTWIDATLALTEGRGGRFEEIDGQVVYLSKGDEPQLIVAFCRSGRPMLAKPELGKLAANLSINDSELEAIWTNASERIRSCPRICDSFTREIWPSITAAAADALIVVSGNSGNQSEPGKARDSINRWFKNWCSEHRTAKTVEQIMRHSIDVAEGSVPLNEAWAMGEAWRKLYPALVSRISHGGLVDESNPTDDSNWNAFATVAREMEKIAFGPPVVNLRKMLALIDAKILCLDALTWNLGAVGELINPNTSAEDQNPVLVDVLVNAVIPVTTYHSPDSPLGKLVERGEIGLMPGCETIHVDENGSPTDAQEEPVEGLAIFGRATEGCVLGNDTLSRKLHSHIENWATCVAEKIQRVASPTPHLNPGTTT